MYWQASNVFDFEGQNNKIGLNTESGESIKSFDRCGFGAVLGYLHFFISTVQCPKFFPLFKFFLGYVLLVVG